MTIANVHLIITVPKSMLLVRLIRYVFFQNSAKRMLNGQMEKHQKINTEWNVRVILIERMEVKKTMWIMCPKNNVIICILNVEKINVLKGSNLQLMVIVKHVHHTPMFQTMERNVLRTNALKMNSF